MGLIGQDAAVAARRCRAFPDGASIAVRELTPPPETWTDCQLVIAVASEDAGIRAAADVGIDDAGSVWRETLLLRDWLRADPVVRAEALGHGARVDPLIRHLPGATVTSGRSPKTLVRCNLHQLCRIYSRPERWHFEAPNPLRSRS